MRLTVLLFLLALSTAASAQDLSKAQLASRFYDATTAQLIGTAVSTATTAIVRDNPKKKRQSEIYRQWALETFGSKEYKEIYIQYYIANYSREELLAMNEWAKNPMFLRYMEKTQQFAKWSEPHFQKILSVRNEELARRMHAAGIDPAK